VAASLDVAHKLREILSSRYQCHVVCLNTADNYEPNLIDNDVCENWTLTDPVKLITYDSLNTSDLVLADHLQMITSPPDWDIEKEKAWCLMCQHWLIFLQKFKKHLALADVIIKAVPSDRPSKSDYYQQIQTQITDVLYLQRDLDQADQQIRTLIANDNVPSALKASIVLAREGL